MSISLVILAAGMGSRYGAGIKQLAKVGTNGEAIIDYSITDAVNAGFDQIILVLRREIFDDFMEAVGNRMEAYLRERNVRWTYVFQEIAEGRAKPWGTGEAVLLCKEAADGPFVVINADDYYGREAFTMAYAFCSTVSESTQYGMVAYPLIHTLSPTGGVNRGLCVCNADGELIRVHETRHIVATPNGAGIRREDHVEEIDRNALASMNFWIFQNSVFDVLENCFRTFLSSLSEGKKQEFVLTEVIDGAIRDGLCSVRVLRTKERWLGITYQQDLEDIAEKFHLLRPNP